MNFYPSNTPVDLAPKKSGADYASRGHFLKELGFRTYSDYLASDLWQRVRQKVLRHRGFRCQICDRYATTVHHSRYHKNDLLGRKLKYLHALCRPCHRAIEFNLDGITKKTLEDANRVLHYLSQKEADGTTAVAKAAKIHAELDAEFASMFGFTY